MKNIIVYDEDAKKIEELAKDNHTSTAEIVETLFYILKDNDIRIQSYL